MTLLTELTKVLKDLEQYARLNDREAMMLTVGKAQSLVANMTEPKILDPKSQLACLQAMAESMKKIADIKEAQMRQ